MRTLLVSLVVLFAVGCTTVTLAPCDIPDSGVMGDSQVMGDAGTDANVDPTIRDFRLTVLTNPITLTAGTTVDLQIRVERAPNYTNPVLLVPWGLPDGADYQNRENRAGEDITTIHVRVPDDAEIPSGEGNYVIDGSDGTGLRESTPAHWIVP